MNTITETLNSYTDLSDKAKSFLNKICKNRSVPKNTLILDQGDTCKYMYYIMKGAVRGFYREEGNDICGWFVFENEFFTSYYSFINQQPTFELIEALEDCELQMIDYNNLQILYEEFPEILKIYRKLIEMYYCQMELRLYSLQCKTAIDRYNKMLEDEPFLLNRVSLSHLASYLGMSRETLSRVRAKT